MGAIYAYRAPSVSFAYADGFLSRIFVIFGPT